MKIPIALQIALLAVLMTAFYAMVGQAVPQKEVHPPEVVEMAADISTTEMVEIGKEIFDGKGICITCHNGSARFPDLEGIAGRAGSRIPGLSAVDYLAQSLYEPEVFIVPGFTGGMPVINKPPIGLNDQEILAVIAYLQTLGGEATVNMGTKFVYTGGEATMAEAVPAAADGTRTPLAAFGCDTCHGQQASSLDGVGQRMTRAQLFAALGSHPSEDRLAGATLSELRSLVDHMLEGGQG